MVGNGTETRGNTLPMVLEPQRPRPTLARLTPKAAFLSQLIAGRQHLAAGLQRRQPPPAQAVDAYASGARITISRLPPGYRRTVLA
jgi:hypothetical protein